MNVEKSVFSENACVSFMQWALPHMHMRWKGFRRVHGQVCKRLKKRLSLLNLIDLHEYQQYLQEHPGEWHVLDKMCRITVTRFYRDRVLFERIVTDIFPSVISQLDKCSQHNIHLWSAGCAAGEEPYTVKIIWQLLFARQFQRTQLHIVATDINPELLRRAQEACYQFSSVKRLPEEWLKATFLKKGEIYCLKERFKHDIEFTQHDIRTSFNEARFHIVMCRNLAFTYYTDDLQQQVLNNIFKVLLPGGFLIVGAHENFLDEQKRFAVISKPLGIYQRINQ